MKNILLLSPVSIFTQKHVGNDMFDLFCLKQSEYSVINSGETIVEENLWIKFDRMQETVMIFCMEMQIWFDQPPGWLKIFHNQNKSSKFTDHCF